MQAALRWVLFLVCVAIFAGLAYVASLDFRDYRPSGFLDIARHGLLVPGLLPLAVACVAIFVDRVSVTARCSLVGAVVVLHFVVVAISAHEERPYWIAQFAEAIFCVAAISHLWRSSSSTAR
jgi:hypothetical protein